MTRKQAKSPGFERLTQLELSRILGYSDRTVRLWEREGIPRNPSGTYNLRHVLAWLASRYERRIIDALETRHGVGETVQFLLDSQAERLEATDANS